MTRPPPPHDHPHRLEASEKALRAAYDTLVLKHVQAGWSEADIALGIEALAQEHIAHLGGREAEEVVTLAAYEAQHDRVARLDAQALEEQRRMLAGIPQPPSSWPWVAVGAIFAIAAVVIARLIG